MFWLEKVFHLEAKWHEGIFFGIKDESEIAVVGTPHGIFFFPKTSAEFQKRILVMVCCSTASKELREKS